MRDIRLMVCIVLFPVCLALVGCSDSPSTADGLQVGASKVAGQLANLRTSVAQQGSSGGFVDVNGDGIDDLVVCAPFAAQGETLGVAFVYFGTVNGFTDEPKLVLKGGDNFGFAFVSLGDVDGDGKGDFAISALHGSDDNVSLSGSVTVFKGGGNGSIITMLSGEAALDRFGYALAAGDLNGDGTKELVIGAPFHSPSPALYQQGAVYLYDFKTGVLKAIKANASLQGIGSTVAAGDINGDAYDDLLISTATTYGVGNKVQVFHGRADLVASPAGPTLTVSSMASGFGDSLRVIPDLNGDGYQDFLIGASRAAVGTATEMGVLLVVKGGAQTGTLNLDSTPAALLQKITGQNAYDRFGSPAVAIGDIDGGGKPEVAVAALHADSGSTLMTGKVYLLRGEDLATGTAQLATATVIGGPGKDMHFGKILVPFAKNGPKLLLGAPTAFLNSGGVYGFNPVGATPLFQVSYGGITTTSADCCK